MGDPNETSKKVGIQPGLEEQWNLMLDQCDIIFHPKPGTHFIHGIFSGDKWVGFYTLAQQIKAFEQTVKDKSPGLAASQFNVLINRLGTSLHDRSISVDKGIVVAWKLTSMAVTYHLT